MNLYRSISGVLTLALLATLCLGACAGSPVQPSGKGDKVTVPADTSPPGQTEASPSPEPEVQESPLAPAAGISDFKVLSLVCDPLSADHALDLSCSFMSDQPLPEGSLVLDLVLSPDDQGLPRADTAVKDFHARITVDVPSGKGSLQSLSGLHLDTPYHWKLSLVLSDRTAVQEGELVISSRQVQAFDARVSLHFRQALCKDMDFAFDPALGPLLGTLDPQKKPPMPPLKNLEVPPFEGHRPDTWDKAARVGLEFRYVPSKPTPVSVKEQSGLLGTMEYRYAYPGNITSPWISAYDYVALEAGASVQVYPEPGSPLLGRDWHFAWPLVRNCRSVITLEYRLRGKAPQSYRVLSSGPGVVVTAEQLGIADPGELESFAWRLDLVDEKKAGDLGPLGPIGPDVMIPSLYTTETFTMKGWIPGPEMLVIAESSPAGPFPVGRNSGNPDERPQVQCSLANPFSMASHVLTNQQGAEILNRLVRYRGAKVKSAISPGMDSLVDTFGRTVLGLGGLDFGTQIGLVYTANPEGKFRFKPIPGKENHPLVGISWAGAIWLCNELSLSSGRAPAYDEESGILLPVAPQGFRLPLELEWEAAASAARGWATPWGGRIDGSTANYERSRDSFEDLKPPFTAKGGPTVPVDAYRARRAALAGKTANGPEGFTLKEFWRLDMMGNVWEWCQDWYSPDRYRHLPALIAGEAPELDDAAFKLLKLQGLKLSRTVRGGAWNSLPEELYAQNRGSFPPDSTSHSIGFRVALTLGTVQ